MAVHVVVYGARLTVMLDNNSYSTRINHKRGSVRVIVISRMMLYLATIFFDSLLWKKVVFLVAEL